MLYVLWPAVLIAVALGQVPKEKPPVATYFGREIDADERRIVVGSFNGKSEDGRLDVFVAAGKSWQHAGQFVPPGPPIDNLGNEFRLAGNTLIVGDPLRASGVGGLHLFTITPRGRLGKGRPISLFASDAQLYCQFGSVLVTGPDTLIVGAPLAYFPNASGGAVYIFRKRDSKWIEEQKITTDYSPDDRIFFGRSFAFDARLLAVGAPLADLPPRSYRGAVFLFAPTPEGSYSPAHPTMLAIADDPSESAFGGRIAMNKNWLFVSATEATVGANADQGIVYAWRRDEQGLVGEQPTVRLVNTAGAAGDKFGTALQANDSIVCIGSGAQQVDGMANAGTVCVYRIGDDGSLPEAPSQRLTAPTVAEHARFGDQVVVSSGRILVGAVGEQKNVGAVYIYESAGDVHQATFRFSPIDGVQTLTRRGSR